MIPTDRQPAFESLHRFLSDPQMRSLHWRFLDLSVTYALPNVPELIAQSSHIAIFNGCQNNLNFNCSDDHLEMDDSVGKQVDSGSNMDVSNISTNVLFEELFLLSANREMRHGLLS
jgi:hypothetical protein